VEAGISDLSAPENRYERPRGKLLEVYMPVHTPSGRPLLFETYLRFSDVAASGRKVWLTFLPALVVALLMLWLLQLPIALSLARRLRRAHAEREALLLRALNASDTERRVIAADLHDGVVQDLAGTSYALAVAAENVDVTPTNEVARALRSGADATRQSMRQLRSLLVEIYPPNLRDAGLEPALNDLAARAVARGVAVDVDVADGLRPSDAVERLVFRTAQEALRNVVEHAGAGTCSNEVDANGRGVVLVVADNGRGFERAVLDDRRAQGHLGLALLADQAADLGGSLDIDSTPGAGTRVTLTVPER
ncbi:MAG: sensor histidine kinase, partial [Gaiellaceae bacterium]